MFVAAKAVAKVTMLDVGAGQTISQLRSRLPVEGLQAVVGLYRRGVDSRELGRLEEPTHRMRAPQRGFRAQR